MFDGQRIYLRPVERADLPLRPLWFNDEEIHRTLLMDIPVSLAGTEAWFQRSVGDPAKLNLSIVARDTDKVIGMTGLLDISHRHRKAQFYITIGAKDYWGKRLPSEVMPLVLTHGFSELNLNKIYLYTIPANERARHVYEKIGFRQEAVLKQDFYCRGKLQDIIIHAIYQSDWHHPVVDHA